MLSPLRSTSDTWSGVTEPCFLLCTWSTCSQLLVTHALTQPPLVCVPETLISYLDRFQSLEGTVVKPLKLEDLLSIL